LNVTKPHNPKEMGYDEHSFGGFPYSAILQLSQTFPKLKDTATNPDVQIAEVFE